jgi:hypothetical protein
MNRTCLIAPALALALGSAGAFAQTSDEEAAAVEPGAEPIVQQAVIEEQRTGQMLSTDLIGADVMHAEHGRIGTLDGILFDQTGQIVGGIVAVGGFLGIGAKDVALSWDEFDVRPGENAVYVDMTQAQLEAAPEFKDRDEILAEEAAERAREDLEAQQEMLQNGVQSDSEGQAGAGDDSY